MKKIIIFSILLAGSLFTSCNSNTYDEISFVANPTYVANVGPIIKSSCSGCHSGGSRFPNLETYAEVKEAISNGDLICRIDDPSVCFGKIMPESGRMPQTTIDMIKLWRDQGFVN
jgi:hypothetical protein